VCVKQKPTVGQPLNLQTLFLLFLLFFLLFFSLLLLVVLISRAEARHWRATTTASNSNNNKQQGGFADLAADARRLNNLPEIVRKRNVHQTWGHIHRIWMRWGAERAGRHARRSLSWSRDSKRPNEHRCSGCSKI
jgi:hypothetical protein